MCVVYLTALIELYKEENKSLLIPSWAEGSLGSAPGGEGEGGSLDPGDRAAERGRGTFFAEINKNSTQNRLTCIIILYRSLYFSQSN